MACGITRLIANRARMRWDGTSSTSVTKPVTLAELSRALVCIWNGIPQAFFTNLVGSMRRRCNACITANGGHTRYWLCDMVLETFLICWALVMKWVFFSHFWIPWTSMKCVLWQIWNILLLSATMLLFCITFYQCTVSFFRWYIVTVCYGITHYTKLLA